MSFCIWGPVTDILFQTMECIFPLNSLHPQQSQKQASKQPEGPDPHCQPTTPDCSAVRAGTGKVWEFSAKCTEYFGSSLQAVDGPWVSFPQAEGTHHLRNLSSQQHEGARAPYAKGLPLLPRVHPRCSPNLFLMIPVMHMVVPETGVCLGTSVSSWPSES